MRRVEQGTSERFSKRSSWLRQTKENTWTDKKKGTFGLVSAKEIKGKPIFTQSRYVVTIKHEDHASTIFKARLVLKDHGDQVKGSAVHNSYIVKQSSMQKLVALENILGFDV